MFVEYLDHRPSVLAISSIVLARLCIMKDEDPWPSSLESFGKCLILFKKARIISARIPIEHFFKELFSIFPF